MNIWKKSVNVLDSLTGEQIYLVMFAIYLMISFLETTSFMQFFSFNALNHLTYLLAIVVLIKMFLMDGLSVVQLIARLMLLLVAFLSWRRSQSNQIILMMIFIVGATNVSFDKIIRWFYGIELILITAVILFSICGIIQNYVYHPVGRPVRFSLGISYPTDLSSHILFLMLAHCYLYYRRLNYRYYFAYFAVAIAFLLVTNGRLSFICEVLMILACILAKMSEKGFASAQIITVCYWITTPILALTAMLLSYLYNPHITLLYAINNGLSGRLALGNQALHKGLYFFGNKIHENGLGGSNGMAIFLGHVHQKYFFIDSSYLRLFLIYGIVVACIIITFMIIIGFRATVQKNYPLMIAILIVSITCFAEQHLLEISFNPFLLALMASSTIHLEETNEKNEFKGNYDNN